MRIHGAVLEAVGASTPYAESRPISVLELELDGPGQHELLVRIEAAGVCHSDLSVVDGTRPRAVPLLLGHEAAGIVEEVGAGVSDVVLGDRVAMAFLPRCEECDPCRTFGRTACAPGSAANAEGRLLDGGRRLHSDGRNVDHHLGVSAFATYAVVDRRSAVVVGPDIPAPVAAVLGCAVLTGGGAVLNAGGLRSGENLTVVGLGGVGMAAVLVGAALDDVHVTAVDQNPVKLERALELGASVACTPQEALTRGLLADVVLEAVGRVVAFESAVALTAPGGRTVVTGLPAPDVLAAISPLRLVAEGRSVIGSYLGSSVPARDIPRFADLWRSGKLPVERLISATIELNGLNEAMDSLAAGEALRQIVLPPTSYRREEAP